MSALKAMYALAALVRNSAAIRARFLDAGGLGVVQGLLAGGATPPRLRRRALNLLTDLMEAEPALQAALAADRDALLGILQLLGDDGARRARHCWLALGCLLAAGAGAPSAHAAARSQPAGDMDMQEKALLAIRGIMKSHPASGGLLLDLGAQPVLRQLQQAYFQSAKEQQAQGEEDYARFMLRLADEVLQLLRQQQRGQQGAAASGKLEL
jgi:hypothetical protein